MESPETHFQQIVEELTSADEGIVLGKMMSSPGLKYNNKVFAFFHEDSMGFRLRPNFDPDKFGLLDPQPLSPFKTKPPLKGWFIINVEEQASWPTLAELALAFTKTLRK